MTSKALTAWALAIRPRTLVAGLVPVLVGSALALHDGVFKLSPALAALAGALLIQCGTNLTNDYFDFKKGADTSDRLGPARATQSGWLAPRTVLSAGLGCFFAAALVGLYLVAVAGWPILVVGLLSIASGYAYTGGPYPLAYNGLGELFVLVFFGFVAVAGTYFVQALDVTAQAILAGVPVGLLGVALLAVNNTRDEATDALAGKRTLVVRFGKPFGRAEYLGAVSLAAAIPGAMWFSGHSSAWILLPLATLPLAIEPIRILMTESGAALNRALAATARFQFVFGVLFSVGLSR
jgi:1,4-dihydroxy-2-naphthoate octaprenyltransferase